MGCICPKMKVICPKIIANVELHFTISSIRYKLLKCKSLKVTILTPKNGTTNTDKPDLVVAAGFSNNSFIGSASMIFNNINNINNINNKFNKIIIINYFKYQYMQTKACKTRDKKKIKYPDDKIKIYQPEKKLNDIMAKKFDNMIRNKLNLNNVHLLGKCAGGGIMIHLLCNDKTGIYKALYLAVPGNYFGVEKLLELDGDRLKQIRFVFSWTKQNIFKFHWGIESKDEKVHYDNKMELIEKEKNIILNYKSILENLPNTIPDEKLYHEINQKLIDEICK